MCRRAYDTVHVTLACEARLMGGLGQTQGVPYTVHVLYHMLNTVTS